MRLDRIRTRSHLLAKILVVLLWFIAIAVVIVGGWLLVSDLVKRQQRAAPMRDAWSPIETPVPSAPQSPPPTQLEDRQSVRTGQADTRHLPAGRFSGGQSQQQNCYPGVRCATGVWALNAASRSVSQSFRLWAGQRCWLDPRTKTPRQLQHVPH